MSGFERMKRGHRGVVNKGNPMFNNGRAVQPTRNYKYMMEMKKKKEREMLLAKRHQQLIDLENKRMAILEQRMDEEKKSAPSTISEDTEELELYLCEDEEGNRFYVDDKGNQVEIPSGYEIEIEEEEDDIQQDAGYDDYEIQPSHIKETDTTIKHHHHHHHRRQVPGSIPAEAPVNRRHSSGALVPDPPSRNSSPPPPASSGKKTNVMSMAAIEVKSLEQIEKEYSEKNGSTAGYSDRNNENTPKTSSKERIAKIGSSSLSIVEDVYVTKETLSREDHSIMTATIGSQVMCQSLIKFHDVDFGGDKMSPFGSLVMGVKYPQGKAQKEKTKKDVFMHHIVDEIKKYTCIVGYENKMSMMNAYRSSMEDRFMKNLSNLVQMHNKKLCNGLLIMPNASKHHSRFPSTGFALAMKQNAKQPIPLRTELLNSLKIGYGTFAVRIDPKLKISTKSKEGSGSSEELNILSLIAYKKKSIMKKMKTCKEMKPFRDNQLKPGRGCYIGLYVSQNKDKLWSQDIWIVVQCGDEKKSQEFFKIVQNACSDQQKKQTFFEDEKKEEEETFVSWGATLYKSKKNDLGKLLKEISNARVEAAVSLMKCIGFKDTTKNTLLKMTHLETRTNFFGHDRETDSFVYYSGCTPILNNHKHPDASVTSQKPTSAVIVQECPAAGPTILKGPPFDINKDNMSNILGGVWRPIPGVFNAFPCVTGRYSSAFSKEEELERDDEYEYLSDKFFWESKDNADTFHPRLARGVYRERNICWKSLETTLGWNPIYGEIHLKPVLVMMAPPPEPSLFDKYSV